MPVFFIIPGSINSILFPAPVGSILIIFHPTLVFKIIYILLAYFSNCYIAPKFSSLLSFLITISTLIVSSAILGSDYISPPIPPIIIVIIIIITKSSLAFLLYCCCYYPYFLLLLLAAGPAFYFIPTALLAVLLLLLFLLSFFILLLLLSSRN